MSRTLTVAVAQMGPVARDENRVQVVNRLIAMLRRAHDRGATLVVFPELALTTFFPRWVLDSQDEIDSFFETEIPSNETQPLFEVAKDLGVAILSFSSDPSPRALPSFSRGLLTLELSLRSVCLEVRLPGCTTKAAQRFVLSLPSLLVQALKLDSVVRASQLEAP